MDQQVVQYGERALEEATNWRGISCFILFYLVDCFRLKDQDPQVPRVDSPFRKRGMGSGVETQCIRSVVGSIRRF